MKHERCGYVVGQVANQAALPATREFFKIHAQRIGKVKMKIFKPPKLFLQPRSQIPVYFNHVQLTAAIQQRAGQRSLPWPDFDEQFTLLWLDCCNDVIDNRLITKKILSKPFTGVMAHRAIISLAVLIASSRLPTSALQLPAISSAVP